MLDQSANGRSQFRQQLRRTVQTLSDLLALIFPEPHSLDIITYEDIQKRYPLTEMRGPAVTALAQSRRILRAVGDFRQMGLCSFHHGLCYLYWDDCGSAREHFDEARRQWAFNNETSAVSLAYFAMARTRHHLYQDEAAMTLYGKAEQWQQRIHFSPTSEGLTLFSSRLTEEMRSAQEGLRERMWPREQTRQARKAGLENGRFPTQETILPEDEPVDSEAPTHNGAPVPAPMLNLGKQGFVPVPGHNNREGSRFEWYRVVERQRDDIFPDEIQESSWLLVDRNVQAHPTDEQKLIVVRVDDGSGSIVLQPLQPQRPFQRIYLANVLPDRLYFVRDVATGEIELSREERTRRVNESNLLGVVIGYWMSYSKKRERV